MTVTIDVDSALLVGLMIWNFGFAITMHSRPWRVLYVVLAMLTAYQLGLTR